MAVPFKYGMDFLLPAVLKQFASIGRFAWPFYYVIIIFSFIFIWKLFSKKYAVAIIIVSIILLFTEGLSYHIIIRKEISKSPNIFQKESINNLKNINYHY